MGVSFLARGWFDKIINFIGYSDQEEDEDSFIEDAYRDGVRGRKSAPVLSLHSAPEVKIIVMTPASFDEAETVAGNLKNRKPVIVNFSKITKEAAQRFLDFLSGTVFALHGNMQRVSKDTFLFVPSNMTVHSDLQESIPQDQFSLNMERNDGHDR